MIRVVVGDLAMIEAEAILRPVAADWSAVTPAMRRLELAAGRVLAQRCEGLGELPVGSAVITDAGDVRAQFMIHVVVRSREEPVSMATVRKAVRNGLRRAAEWGIQELFSAPVGLGAGNLELEDCAAAMTAEIAAHLAGDEPPREIVIVADSELARDVFERAVRDLA